MDKSVHKNGSVPAVSLQGFVLVGFGGGAETQILLFAVFLPLYMLTVLGNLTMIMVITLDAGLHSPMYFFLKNLSFVDLCLSSVIVPNALVNIFSSSKVISFEGCATQLFLFSMLGAIEAFLLAVMAYDRFMAICSPLRYSVAMSPATCAHLVLGTFCVGCLNAIVQTSLTFQLPFCSSNHINSFFCDIPPLIKLACADTTLNELVILGISGFIILCAVLVIIISYGYITVTILRMESGSGRHKVFSTCGSHMTAVSLLYGTGFAIYGQPGSMDSTEQGNLVSIIYTLVIPMFNPLIYSLRNKDVKDALRRLGQRHSLVKKSGWCHHQGLC
ncbi:olfactory receptor 12-like [Arvicola amphibius]|uniref:olfactory receptor 12-like n=1 Tax=Arvicola amphibius TaxID=1047088 RepID=UPI0018E35E78|nr:olfactory receptor 12-like [Arvicola amphibius]